MPLWVLLQQASQCYLPGSVKESEKELVGIITQLGKGCLASLIAGCQVPTPWVL